MMRHSSKRSVGLRFFSQQFRLKESYGMYINGKEVEALNNSFLDLVNPADGTVHSRVANGGVEDVNLAVKAARESFESGVWSKADPRDRCRVMHRAASLLAARVPEIAQIESVSTGRAIREMNAQLGRLPEWLEYFGSLIRTQEGSVPPFFGPYVNYVRRIPLGVVGQITPWNHPLLIAIKKISPALAAGNSIVVKPSELAPAAVIEFAKILTEAGLPNGVLNVVTGLGAVSGKALAEHPNLAKIDLTGGTETGRAVAAAAGKNLVSVIAELGGKAPVIVFEDADIEQAINGAAFATFIASGQTCVMGARLLIHKSIYSKFMDQYLRKVKSIRVGPPSDPTTQMGPVVSKSQLNRVEHFMRIAEQEGAKVLFGGKRATGSHLNPNGFYFEPTVLEVTPTMTVAREEIFGPVVVTMPFEDESDAIRLANDSPYGLAASVWTQNIKRGHRVAESLDVGLVWLNDHHRNDPSSPWGGMKDSGMGRENGWEALHEYSQSKSVVVNMSDKPFDWFVNDQTVRYS